ncbi:hypothetical protein EAN99_29730 [Klebsiella pneumoniae]|nr:hypothetical protein EAN99_29730 [Klebsiella pneumoniae]
MLLPFLTGFYVVWRFLALSIIPKPNRALRKLAVFVMTIGFSLALAITVAYFAVNTLTSAIHSV